MTNSKVIAITLYRRPEYTRQMLEALSQCYGIEDYRVLISCDVNPQHQRACDEVVMLAYEFALKHQGTEVFVNNPALGCDLNKLFILPKAYELSDYVIFIEDDCVPAAKDTLCFFEQMGERFRDDPTVLSITAFNRPDHGDGLYTIFHGSGFTPWGWAMWRDRYDRLVGDGRAYKEHYGSLVNSGFDNWMCINTQPGERHFGPVQPRIQCIGAEDAEHTPSGTWHMEHMHQSFGAWQHELPIPTPEMWSERNV